MFGQSLPITELIRTKNPKNLPPWRQNSGLRGTLNDETSNAIVEFKNLGLTKAQGMQLMDHYGVFIVSDLTCGGTNKACKPETLKIIDEYSKTLETSYGFNGRNMELTDDERVKNYSGIRVTRGLEYVTRRYVTRGFREKYGFLRSKMAKSWHKYLAST